MMRIGSENPLLTALDGLQVGVERARTASREVARLTTGSESVQDTVRPLLELHKAETEVSLESKIVKAQDESLGRLIDVKV